MRDCVPILRREIVAIREAGAATVQLDEPWLSAMVDSRFREREGISAPHYQMDLCADLINQTVSGITGIDTAIHLCHAHFNRRHVSEGEYDLIMPTLAKIRVGTISMEYATPVSGGYSALSKFPDGVRLGLGCVDHCDRRVETPQVVVDRVERAMRYIDRDRITLHPDCGFAPSVQNPMDLDEACQKLKAMCEAAAILRSRYG
jgi:5-methyltetrahydropteroyltriglutamate--homocysteine methyltransferase